MENQKKRNNVIIFSSIIFIVCAWFLTAHFRGPNSEYAIHQEADRLRQDSIALQGDFRPHGQYSFYQDIDTEIDKIRNLGNPLRFGNTEPDSARMFGNPILSPIARYNMAKCDSILKEVLPMWRIKFGFVLNSQLREKSTIVRISKDVENNAGLEIYSMRYLSKDEIDHDAIRLNGAIANLGFKKVVYALSPENNGIEYTFN